MSAPPPEESSPANASSSRGSVSMPVGIAVAVATAGITCILIAALMGRFTPKQAPPPEPTAITAPTPDAEPEDAAVDGSVDAANDGSADAIPDGALAASPADELPIADAPSGSPDCSLPEKDIAREAWRRNMPTICVVNDGRKAAIFLPVKGSTQDSKVGVRRRPFREARVWLPKASSLLTMRQYKLDRDGFVDLRPSDGSEGSTTLKLKLQSRAGDPVFDVKDTYVKVTVARPR